MIFQWLGCQRKKRKEKKESNRKPVCVRTLEGVTSHRRMEENWSDIPRR